MSIDNDKIIDLSIRLIKIHENREFHYTDYGGFIVVMIKSNDYLNGYINASKLCIYGDKLYKNWNQIEKSKNLIKYAEDRLKIEVADTTANTEISKFELKIAGSKENNAISGTYVHKRLILNIACWISDEFYWRCSEIIENYFLKNYKDDINNYQIKIVEYTKIMEEKECVINRLSTNIDNLSKTIENMKTDVGPRPINEEKIQNFILYKISNKLYYVSMTQVSKIISTYNKLVQEYPGITEIETWDNIPNARYLFNKLKDELSEFIAVKFNKIELLNDFEEDGLIDKIEEIRLNRDHN